MQAFVDEPKTKSAGGTSEKFVMGNTLDMLFDPSDDAMKETTDYVIEYAGQVAIAMKGEMEDSSKQTSKHLSTLNGERSFYAMTEAERQAGKGKHATNNPAESTFVVGKEEVRKYGPNLLLFNVEGKVLH